MWTLLVGAGVEDAAMKLVVLRFCPVLFFSLENHEFVVPRNGSRVCHIPETEACITRHEARRIMSL